MTPPPVPARTQRTALDRRIETAVGWSVEDLQRHRDHGLLDPPYAALADAHRAVVAAERDVTFLRGRLARLAASELPADQHLFARIKRTLDQLAEAVDVRDGKVATAIGVLKRVEAAAPRQAPQQVAAADAAALLAIARGAKLHEHLITHRLTVATPSRTRIPYAQLQRLEANGLVERDTAHPLQAGQPVTLTNAGRAALTAPRRARPPDTSPAHRSPAHSAAARLHR